MTPIVIKGEKIELFCKFMFGKTSFAYPVGAGFTSTKSQWSKEENSNQEQKIETRTWKT